MAGEIGKPVTVKGTLMEQLLESVAAQHQAYARAYDSWAQHVVFVNYRDYEHLTDALGYLSKNSPK